jgi:hypothetical protein
MADKIIKFLKKNENLYLISQRGNKKLWFSLEKPEFFTGGIG